MNFFSGPPASAMNRSTMPVPSVAPPPTMTSVPLAGPYSRRPLGGGQRRRLRARLCLGTRRLRCLPLAARRRGRLIRLGLGPSRVNGKCHEHQRAGLSLSDVVACLVPPGARGRHRSAARVPVGRAFYIEAPRGFRSPVPRHLCRSCSGAAPPRPPPVSRAVSNDRAWRAAQAIPPLAKNRGAGPPSPRVAVGAHAGPVAPVPNRAVVGRLAVLGTLAMANVHGSLGAPLQTRPDIGRETGCGRSRSAA